MRAHQIMTRDVITVSPHASIMDAANIMLRCHLSGLPVMGEDGMLKGIVSESDFLCRGEIGTGRRRPGWLQFFAGPGRAAIDFVHERGRHVEDVMTPDPITVDEQTPLDELVRIMEKRRVKRLPVMSGKMLVGIITRANILQAVASLAKEIPDPTADDQHIRDRILRQIQGTDWRPAGFQVTVRNGVVHLHGVIFDASTRKAAIVLAENTAGVKAVDDHLCFVDTYSGYYVEPPEDVSAAR
ncbi:CBS domain-containing protein [Bradyrhizobium neotropicale]|uniref:CBS domain-containing protein n=1 Tax=Bradyrhizobium neotropicale TaxID=1497615 RepID=UPI001AD77805|nr:CBS domain-containing protein [Bradyrhizobium neotropicale]MBO4221819.1 CBS domain-containing protein [Bradyrhizobium neotropicale]